MMAAGIGALLIGLIFLIGTLAVFVWLWWRVLEKAGYPGWVAAAIAGIYVVLSILDMVLGIGLLGLIGTIGIVVLLVAFALIPWPREGGKGLPFGPQPIPGAAVPGQPTPYGAPSGYPAPPAGYPAPPPYGQPQPPGYPQAAQGPAGYGQPPVAPPPSYGQPPVAPPPPSYGQPPVAPPPPSYGQPAVAPPPPSYGQPPAAPPGGGEPEATIIGGRSMPSAGGGPAVAPPPSGPGAAPPPGAPAAAGGPGWALSTPGPGGAPFMLTMTDSKALYIVSGQGGGGDLIVPEASIGNPHARLHLAGGRLGLEDLGSPGGTAIDGAQLLPSHGIREVTQSKKLRFGALEFSLTRT